MRSADVVVIGAGVIGCSIAYHLASRCVRNVRVVDRAAGFGAGSTPKATGGFRSQFGTAVNVRLSMLSREKLLRFQDEIGVDSGYRPYGYLFMARTESELDELFAAQRVQHACGVTEARMVTADEIHKLNPAVRDDSLIGGTFCPTDGFIVANQRVSVYRCFATFRSIPNTRGKVCTRCRPIGTRSSAAIPNARISISRTDRQVMV